MNMVEAITFLSNRRKFGLQRKQEGLIFLSNISLYHGFNHVHEQAHLTELSNSVKVYFSSLQLHLIPLRRKL